MNNKEIKNVLIIGIVSTIISSIISFNIDLICGIICLILGSVLTTVFCVYTKKRYNNLLELNNYLSLICSGNYDFNINENAEGELSILKNNLLKVVTLLQTQNSKLNEDKVYLAQSLADISHQLKTPLTSMMVMSDLIKSVDDFERKKEFYAVIDTQLDKMQWMITNILKISKLDAGTTELVKEPVSVENLITSSLNSFLVLMELKNITLNCIVSDFNIMCDKAWTTEALQNIIKNCIEHTKIGGTLTIRTGQTNLYSEVIISDNGCGIAKDDLPHIFERFYHGKNSDKDSVGIGLALAKTVFEKQFARVDVKSEENVGTEFSVKFYKSIV